MCSRLSEETRKLGPQSSGYVKHRSGALDDQVPQGQISYSQVFTARYPTARRGISLPGAPLLRHSASEAPSLTSNQYIGWEKVDVTIWVTETNSPGSLGWSCPRHVIPTITPDSGDKEQFCDGHNKNIPEGSGRTVCKACPYS